MQVNPTTGSSSATAAGGTSAVAQAVSVDYNAFLKLLVQEMQNQDPTKPTDPTQYLGQLASFSSVEQQIQTNTKLDTMLTNSSLAQAETAIGRTVTSADGATSGKVVSIALGSSGLAIATLANGATLTLDKTVTVSGT